MSGPRPITITKYVRGPGCHKWLPHWFRDTCVFWATVAGVSDVWIDLMGERDGWSRVMDNKVTLDLCFILTPVLQEKSNLHSLDSVSITLRAEQQIQNMHDDVFIADLMNFCDCKLYRKNNIALKTLWNRGNSPNVKLRYTCVPLKRLTNGHILVV